MQRYKDISGNSGVRAFEIARNAIKITFADGKTYLYDSTRPGKRVVEAMKRLALSGKGLATYINKYVRDAYARKISGK